MFPNDTPAAYYLIPGLVALSIPLILHLTSSSASAQQQAQAMAPSTKQHTVVVLGAGIAGVPIAHHLLKHTPGNINLRVILVSPNDAVFWNLASIRALLPSDSANGPGFTDDKVFYPLAPAFAVYGDRFEHVVSRAERLDPDNSTVDVALLAQGPSPSQTRTVAYDTLVIATGSSFKNGLPFKEIASGGTAATKAALAQFRDALRSAKRVVVAGAGQTGVEVVGELGYAYSSGKLRGIDKKDIVLINSDSLPLQAYGGKESVQKDALKQLKQLGVRVLNNTRVADVKPAVAGVDSPTAKKILTLTTEPGGGAKAAAPTTTFLETDVFIPAFGISINSEFAPEKMLDTSPGGQRRLRTRTTLQAENYDNIFVVGDVSNLESGLGKHTSDQVHLLADQLQTHLQNWCLLQQEGDKKDKLPLKPLAVYTPTPGVVFSVTIGPGGGIGQFGSTRLYSLMVWFFKARKLGTDWLADFATGKRTLFKTNW